MTVCCGGHTMTVYGGHRCSHWSSMFYHVTVLLCSSTMIGDWPRACSSGTGVTDVTTSAVLDLSNSSEAATMTDVFASSTFAGDTLTTRGSSVSHSDSPKPPLDITAVWRTSGVYATSSGRVVTTTPVFTDRSLSSARNNITAMFVTTAPRRHSTHAARMTRFSGTSTDVISLATTTTAAATASSSSLSSSSSRETTQRSFEPFVSAGATTTLQFFTDRSTAAAETTWTAATTDVVDRTGGWLSLSVAWIAGAVAAVVVIILSLIVCVIVVISRRLKSSRSSITSSTVRYNKNRDVDMHSRRGKRSKAATSLGVDMDGVCITYTRTRSQPPSSARVPDTMENVFVGAFPHTDRWLSADNDHADNDLFEKDSETDSLREMGTSTFCARNASYRGQASVSVVDHSG